MLFVLFSILLCVSIILWESKRSKATAPALPPTYYWKFPLIGHAHLMLTNTTNIWQRSLPIIEYTAQQGGVIYLKLGPHINYGMTIELGIHLDLTSFVVEVNNQVITDPDDALTVANTCVDKHPLYSFADPWVGQGLINSSGKIWQRHRKLLNPAFSLSMIHGFLDIFNSQSKRLKHNLEHRVGDVAFNPSYDLKSIALTVSCMTAFGDKDIKDEQFYSKYMSAVDEMMNIMIRKIPKLWLHNDTLNTLIGEGKRERELIKTLQELSNEVIKIKRDTYTNRNVSNVSHKSFIDIMIEQGQDSLTDKEIRNELDTTIIAGYETSLLFLETALVLIGSHSEVQERMYKEMLEVVGEDKDVEKEDLQKLVYTDAVIKECLRYLPPAPIIGRHIDREVKLKNYTLRANTNCVLALYGMHRSASWGADVNQFKPERWLDPTLVANNSKAFAAFGIGKRSCIGKVYALTSAKVTLTHIMRAFKITADHTKLKFKIDITLKPVAGNEIRLQRRHK